MPTINISPEELALVKELETVSPYIKAHFDLYRACLVVAKNQTEAAIVMYQSIITWKGSWFRELEARSGQKTGSG